MVMLRILSALALVVAGLATVAAPAGAADVSITYEVGSHGAVSTDVDAFAIHVSTTLDHDDGWSLGGSIDFVPVQRDAELRILIAEPAEIGAIPGCSAQYSCHVSGTVYINEDRWNGGAAGWSASLDGYRHYVVNHEVGHYLGLDHVDCPGAHQPAPVMQQQTIETAPCVNRVWPLPSERQAVADRYGVPVRDADDTTVEFARDLYQRLLGRSPSDGDAETLARAIDDGRTSRAQAATDMYASAEFDAVTGAVGRLYQAAFLRAPDPQGVLYWARQVQQGYAVRDVAGDFAASTEFHARYGDLDDPGFVDLIYRNVLGRSPEAEGREYWVEQLRSGRTDRGGVLDYFAQSPEHRSRHGLDVEVALYYATILDRYGDPDGVAYWTGQLEGGTDRVDVVYVFLESEESVL